MGDIEHAIVDVRRFKEAVWDVERENFRPGDALDALDRAKVDASDSPLTRGAVEALEQVRAEQRRLIDEDGLGADMRDIGYLEGIEFALKLVRGQ